MIDLSVEKKILVSGKLDLVFGFVCDKGGSQKIKKNEWNKSKFLKRIKSEKLVSKRSSLFQNGHNMKWSLFLEPSTFRNGLKMPHFSYKDSLTLYKKTTYSWEAGKK